MPVVILRFMKIFAHFFLSRFLPCLNLTITSISEINSNGDRTTDGDYSTQYMESSPTDACTSFGKHAYTNEDGFGIEYKYNLSFQGTILNVILLSVDFQVYLGSGLNMCSGVTFVVMFGRGLGLERGS